MIWCCHLSFIYDYGSFLLTDKHAVPPGMMYPAAAAMMPQYPFVVSNLMAFCYPGSHYNSTPCCHVIIPFTGILSSKQWLHDGYWHDERSQYLQLPSRLVWCNDEVIYMLCMCGCVIPVAEAKYGREISSPVGSTHGQQGQQAAQAQQQGQELCAVCTGMYWCFVCC